MFSQCFPEQHRILKKEKQKLKVYAKGIFFKTVHHVDPLQEASDGDKDYNYGGASRAALRQYICGRGEEEKIALWRGNALGVWTRTLFKWIFFLPTFENLSYTRRVFARPHRHISVIRMFFTLGQIIKSFSNSPSVYQSLTNIWSTKLSHQTLLRPRCMKDEICCDPCFIDIGVAVAT